jgi:hypothetical protein
LELLTYSAQIRRYRFKARARLTVHLRRYKHGAMVRFKSPKFAGF